MSAGACCRIALVALALSSTIAACQRPDRPSSPPPDVNAPLIVGRDTLGAEQVRRHLADALGFTSRGGRVFCSYTLLGQEGDAFYLSTACEEFVVVADSVEPGSGRGGPVALVVDTLATPVRVLQHAVPGDGNRYAPDVRRIFPDDVQRQIFATAGARGAGAGALRRANREAAAAWSATHDGR